MSETQTPWTPPASAPRPDRRAKGIVAAIAAGCLGLAAAVGGFVGWLASGATMRGEAGTSTVQPGRQQGMDAGRQGFGRHGGPDQFQQGQTQQGQTQQGQTQQGQTQQGQTQQGQTQQGPNGFAGPQQGGTGMGQTRSGGS